MSSPKSRPYQMRRRADQVGQTNQRIVAAAVALHGTVGPAATTIAAIAELAGVTRLTVYRHFPDEDALFAACSAHWIASQQLPDPAAWAEIDEAEPRLRFGLGDLYRFYRAGAGMLASLYHDFAALPEAQRRNLLDQAEAYCAVLVAPFAADGGQQRLVRAVIGHAASFLTWHSLCVELGLTDTEAVEVMVGAVLAVQEAGAVD